MTSVIHEVTTQDKLQLAANKKYDKFNSNTITILSTTPKNVQYTSAKIPLNGGTALEYNTTIGSKTFLDRGLSLEMKVPLTITRSVAAAGVTTTDYISKLFGNFADLSLRQFPFLQCLSNMEVSLNDVPISMISDVGDCFEAISEYVDESELNEEFQASQPDRFYNYNHYTETVKEFETKDLDGAVTKYCATALSTENVFVGGYSNNYNSRRPIFSMPSGVSATAANITTFNTTLTLQTFIPFSIFGLSSDDLSIYGINNFSFKANLKPDWVERMFVTKNNTFASIVFNNAASTNHYVTINTKKYEAPDFITSSLCDASNNILPYRIGLNNIVHYKQPKIPKGSYSTVVSNIVLNSVPSSLYLSIQASRDGALMTTPNYKARIKSIRVRYGNVDTTISNSPMTVFQVAKSNGLSKDQESALYTNGYVLKLDFTKDIGTGGLLVGTTHNAPLEISVDFDSLPDSSTIDYEIKPILVFQGSLLYSNGTFTKSSSLTHANIPFTDANIYRELYNQQKRLDNMIGGGVGSAIWSGIKNLARKGFDYVKNNPEKVMSGLASLGKIAVGGSAYQQMNNITGGSAAVSFSSGAGSVKTLKYK